MKAAIKRASEQGTSKQSVAKRGKLASSQKKKNVPRNLTSVNLGVGFPKRVTCTLKYATSVSVASTIGAVNSHLFSCNGMYDPDITSTGHQPLYFDQLMAIYDHYTVIGSKLRVRACPNTLNQIGAVAIFVNDDTTTSITDIATISEQSSGTQLKVLPIGINEPVLLNSSWSAKQTFGGSVLGNDNLQGTASSNPTEQSYYQICYQDLGAATTTCRFIVEIEYIAVFDELKDQNQN